MIEHAPARHHIRMTWRMTNFFAYMIGVLLVVGALAYGASLMGVSSTWIAVFALAVLGLGVMGAIVKTRQKEPS